MSRPATLRFAVMADNRALRPWEMRAIEHLCAVPGIQLSLLILNADQPAKVSLSRQILDLWKNKRWHYALSLIYFQSVLPRQLNRLMVRVPIVRQQRLSGVPIMPYHVRREQSQSADACEIDTAALRDYDLDFILRFGPDTPCGNILDVPRYGVWSFRYAAARANYDGPPGFWEIYCNDATTGTVLQRLSSQRDGGTILYEGHFRTLKSSYVRNWYQVLSGSVEWPAKVCRDIQNGTARYMDAPPERDHVPTYRMPTNRQLAVFGLRMAWRFLARMVSWPFQISQWNIGVVDQPIHEFLKVEAPQHVRWLPAPPRSYFLADPFAVPTATGLTVLAEYLSYERGVGSIAALEISADQIGDGFKPVIETPTHMSYPYLIRHGDETFCIPETHEAGGVFLYRARQFPNEWEMVSTLIEGRKLVDPTIFRHDNRWWLLALGGPEGGVGPWCTLYGWYAPDLKGPWTPHAGNPLKTDIRSAQPGGTPFVHQGRLYRPSQDNSRVYGGKVVLNEVTRLTTTEYREEIVRIVEPYANSPYNKGLHTLSAAGNMTVLDSHREIFVPAVVRKDLARMVKTALRGLSTGLNRLPRMNPARG